MTASLKTSIGEKALSYLIAKSVKATPPPNPTQSGTAGAIPPHDTAPLTGGPHEAPDTVITPPGGTVVNDGGNFHWRNDQAMADVANEQMRDGHGSNGTSYDNARR